MNATRARTDDRFQNSVVSIERVNLLGVQVTACALLNCAEHQRRSSLGLGRGHRSSAAGQAPGPVDWVPMP